MARIGPSDSNGACVSANHRPPRGPGAPWLEHRRGGVGARPGAASGLPWLTVRIHPCSLTGPLVDSRPRHDSYEHQRRFTQRETRDSRGPLMSLARQDNTHKRSRPDPAPICSKVGYAPAFPGVVPAVHPTKLHSYTRPTLGSRIKRHRWAILCPWKNLGGAATFGPSDLAT